MRICKTCEHCIFNEKWGEVKCKKYQHVIPNPESRTACAEYSKKKEEPKNG